MNNEFKFYTSFLFFKKLKDEKIIDNKEFKKITIKLIDKYKVSIIPFMLDITWLIAQ